MRRSFLAELDWRGLLHQQTEGAAAALEGGVTSGYCGFDATGASLHIGHLVPITGLVHLQRSGHRPVVLVGGGTGMIGDPSGRSSERNLQSLDEVAANAESVRGQLASFIDFSGPAAAIMRNNADWLIPLRLVDFLREVGKHFSVNLMLAKDSVRSRLESGISYTEFSYMLLQAYDFAELYRRDGVTLQIGGSDQWGNITAGTELVRRALGGEAHGITLPLVTGADGRKFGKTAEGTSVWLDPSRTSPYRFFQYFVNTDDRDAGRYLRMFTLLEREAIEAWEAELESHPERRGAQGALAMEVTTRVHGVAAAEAAREASRVIFDRRADPRGLAREVLAMLVGELPHARLGDAAGGDGAGDAAGDAAPGAGGLAIVDALVATGLVASRGEARRQLQQGAVTVNARRLGPEELLVPRGEALHGTYYIVRKGGRDVALVELP